MTHDLPLVDGNGAKIRGHLVAAMVTRWQMAAIYGRYVAQKGRESEAAGAKEA